MVKSVPEPISVATDTEITSRMESIMTKALFSDDAYLKSCSAKVTSVTGQGIVLDQTIFYPLGGGQPGDSGHLETAAGDQVSIVDTRKGEAGAILHLSDSDHDLQPGDVVTAVLNWE
jgi:misacylated tRNA(Ala) deacylase